MPAGSCPLHVRHTAMVKFPVTSGHEEHFRAGLVSTDGVTEVAALLAEECFPDGQRRSGGCVDHRNIVPLECVQRTTACCSAQRLFSFVVERQL